MPFQIAQKTLNDLLSFAARINTRSIIAILECVRLTFGGDGICVETTDMEKWVTLATENFDPRAKDLAVAIVPCKSLHSIVSNIDKTKMISLALTEKRLIVKTDSSKYQFGLLPNDEWRTVKWIEKTKPMKIDAAEFVDCLSFVRQSAAIDDSRYYLCGVSLSVPEKNKLRFAATDGHQLSHTLLDVTGNCEVPNKGILLPRELCNLYIEMLQNLEEESTITLDVSETKARLVFEGEYSAVITGKLIDGAFPDIDRVVPYSMETKPLIFQREDLIKSIQRIAPMANQKLGGPLKIEIDGDQARLSAKSYDTGSEGEEVFAISGDGIKKTVHLAFSKLLSVMKSFGNSTVVIMVSTDKETQAPVIFADTIDKVTPASKRFSIIMPMRG